MPASAPLDDFLTPDAFAARRVLPMLTSASAVRRACRERRIPSTRVGRRLLVSPTAVRHFLERGGTAAAPRSAAADADAA